MDDPQDGLVAVVASPTQPLQKSVIAFFYVIDSWLLPGCGLCAAQASGLQTKHQVPELPTYSKNFIEGEVNIHRHSFFSFSKLVTKLTLAHC